MPDDAPAGGQPPKYLADHFLECCKLGRYLTVMGNDRFIITEDLKQTYMPKDAVTLAAIFSRDTLVAQAALVPLSRATAAKKGRQRDMYERLFDLIEQQALSDRVRGGAKALIERGFREAEIREIEAQLGDRMSPARLKYRQFLETVKRLMDQEMTAYDFVDEFRAFTDAVAGRLDFGIYSFCLDRLFGSVRIPVPVKHLLVGELITFPPLVRRELLTNILAFPGQSPDLCQYVRHTVLTELGRAVAVEMELLEAYKRRRLTAHDLAGTALAAARGPARPVSTPLTH